MVCTRSFSKCKPSLFILLQMWSTVIKKKDVFLSPEPALNLHFSAQKVNFRCSKNCCKSISAAAPLQMQSGHYSSRAIYHVKLLIGTYFSAGEHCGNNVARCSLAPVLSMPSYK